MKKFKTNPPVMGEKILDRLLYNATRYSALGDFSEMYSYYIQDKGILYALCWYWLQVMKVTASYFYIELTWGIIMFRNYFKIALRNIRRNKIYSGINIVGLTVGLTCSILILLWIQDELNYNGSHDYADQLFRVIVEYVDGNRISNTPLAIAPALKDEFPEIINATRFITADGRLIRYGKNTFYENGFGFADPSFFEMFSFSFVKGDPKIALTEPSSVVINEDIAQKYFGNENPIGKILTFENRFDMIVS